MMIMTSYGLVVPVGMAGTSFGPRQLPRAPLSPAELTKLGAAREGRISVVNREKLPDHVETSYRRGRYTRHETASLVALAALLRRSAHRVCKRVGLM